MKLVFHTLIFSVVLLFGVLFGQDNGNSTRVTEVTRLRAANAAQAMEITAHRSRELKDAYDKAQAEFKRQFDEADDRLKAATADAFKEAGVSPDSFEFDALNGTFTARKPKDSTKENPK